MTSVYNPHLRRTFLMDGLGAFVTAALLFFVLRTFNELIGIPKITLIYLAAIAFVLCIYSLSCFCFLKKDHKPFLLAIIIANILYCLLTIGMILNYTSDITMLGKIYFIGEAAIICGLVFFEIRQLKKIPGFCCILIHFNSNPRRCAWSQLFSTKSHTDTLIKTIFRYMSF